MGASIVKITGRANVSSDAGAHYLMQILSCHLFLILFFESVLINILKQETVLWSVDSNMWIRIVAPYPSQVIDWL